MITFLGTIIFVTVIAIGVADRYSGLRLFQKSYASPWRAKGAARVAREPGGRPVQPGHNVAEGAAGQRRGQRACR
jgi:hypothetical protein